jgi:ATP-dependent Clp protease protease subunit
MPGYPVPFVVEQTPRGERAFDIFSRLLEERIVFVAGPITPELANVVIAQLLLLQQKDPKKEIKMYINSPGGSAYAAFAIYDTMQHIKAPLSTIAVGTTASAATALLAAGNKGKRYSLPHSVVHIHQPVGQAGGQATDIEISAKEILRLKSLYAEVLARHTGNAKTKILKDIDRDLFMTPPEAKRYGIVDKVL